MTKPLLRVTHDGQTFTRRTARTYSHVILGYQARPYRNQKNWFGPMWIKLAWVGRPDLVPGEIRKWTKAAVLAGDIDTVIAVEVPKQ